MGVATRTPEQLREQIEETREEIGATIDAMAAKATLAQRRAKSAAVPVLVVAAVLVVAVVAIRRRSS